MGWRGWHMLLPSAFICLALQFSCSVCRRCNMVIAATVRNDCQPTQKAIETQQTTDRPFVS